MIKLEPLISNVMFGFIPNKLLCGFVILYLTIVVHMNVMVDLVHGLFIF